MDAAYSWHLRPWNIQTWHLLNEWMEMGTLAHCIGGNPRGISPPFTYRPTLFGNAPTDLHFFTQWTLPQWPMHSPHFHTNLRYCPSGLVSGHFYFLFAGFPIETLVCGTLKGLIIPLRPSIRWPDTPYFRGQLLTLNVSFLISKCLRKSPRFKKENPWKITLFLPRDEYNRYVTIMHSRMWRITKHSR